ncbi:hypothetical protein JR316_0010229 [Psilocybe cubensis]|uniref:Uncharacterized protein n=1 Tax=Psilocybe cubensis TaxID=181762 RepID=A0ACB8GQR3_PSICU|nr:hypothetical protein JR316_0010229 [Psilocybe cubensis]KAH9477996.1 hypothetical protein JR316_0010229 [Psilocybe cubensis]
MTPPLLTSIQNNADNTDAMELNVDTISAALEALELPVSHNGVEDIPMGNLIVAIVFCLRRFGIIGFNSNVCPNNATSIDIHTVPDNYAGPTEAIRLSDNRAAERNAVIDALFMEQVGVPTAATHASHGEEDPLTSDNACIFVEDSDDEDNISYVSDIPDDMALSGVAANHVAEAVVAASPVAFAPVAAAPVAAIHVAAPIAVAPVAPVATAHVAAAAHVTANHIAAAPVAAAPVAAAHVAAPIAVAPIATAHVAAAAPVAANHIAAAPVATAPVAATHVAAAPVATAPVAAAHVAAPIAVAPIATAHVAAAAPVTANHIAAAPVATAPVAAAPVAAAHTGFCPNCQMQIHFHTPEPYYVVTKGKRVGVFTGWHNVSPLVTGVRGSVYRRYSNEAAAYAAFQEALDAGNVEVKGV